MPRNFIVAGFDFGTSYSKVVLREQNTRRSMVVKFNGHSDGLLPSLIGFDGANLIPPSAKTGCPQIPYLKMLAAHVATGTALADSPVRIPPSVLALSNEKGIDLIRELLAFYFAHVIASVRHFIRTESPWAGFDFTPGNTDDHLIFQLAVPTGLLASSGMTEELFREAFILGHELNGRADAMLASPISKATWSEYVRAAYPWPLDGKGKRYEWQCLIYPEVAAAVQTIFRSRNARDGLYITMDVGAGTVDMNAFLRNTGQHLAMQKVASTHRRLDYYAASVEPLGVHNLRDPYNAVKLRNEREMVAEVKRAISGLYHLAKTHQPNLGTRRGYKTWDRAIFLLFGGGASHPVYRRAFQEGLADVGIADPQIIRLAAPDQLEYPRGADFGRFAVAYGMAFFKPSLDEVRLPHELKTFSELYPRVRTEPSHAFHFDWED